MPGPRVKPTLDTAGDISYAARRTKVALKQLQQRIDEYNAAVEREVRRLDAARAAAGLDPREFRAFEEDPHDFLWAKRWIRQHGGSISAALKRTHPDTGGNAHDFQLTQEAR